MGIAWRPVVQQMQAKLQSPALSTANAGEGQRLLSQLQTAGAAYDSGAIDGAQNTSAAAAAFATWVAQAAPAWAELDRIARGIYSVAANPSTSAQSAFGVTSGQPTPLPFDSTLATVSTLTGRYSAAKALTTSQGYSDLLGAAFLAWSNVYTTLPTTNPTTDGVSPGLESAVQAAIADCQAWLTLVSFT